MAKRLKDSFDIQVMGEEECDDIDTSKPYWAIDPIDGTWAFITHENTEVSVGIVFNPFTNEFFQTQKGEKSYIEMLSLPLRDNPTVAVVNFKPERSHPIVKSLNQLFKEDKMKKLTSIGVSITYAMCMVAKGAYSNYIAYFSRTANAWDLSAACLIIKNAGGYVTDLEGVEINPINHQGYIVASANAQARDDFLGMINPLLVVRISE